MTRGSQITAAAVIIDRDADRDHKQQNVIRTHELGHALGYNHVESRPSIMNPRAGGGLTDFDREAVATHEAGHATVAYFFGKGRRLEVLSIIKRRGSLGLLAHSDEEERLTRTRSEIESGIAIALGGLAAEELCLGESGTGPGADLAHATGLAAQMVGSFGMAGSLISYEAVADGPLSKSNLVGKVLANTETKQKVEDILTAQRERVAAVLEENRDVHTALVQALLERDELVRDDILEVIEKAIANRL